MVDTSNFEKNIIKSQYSRALSDRIAAIIALTEILPK